MNPLCILVTVEGLGINLLGCYGGALSKTPNVDQFAARAVVFDQCWLQSLDVAESLKAVFLGHRYRLTQAIDASASHLPSNSEPSEIALNLKDVLDELDISTCFVTDAVDLAEKQVPRRL